MARAVFLYKQPRSLAEAVALKGELGDEAVLLAGGQSLMPMMNLGLARPEVLVDLNRIRELEWIRVGTDAVSVGALTRYRTALADRTLGQACPLLADTIPHIGHAQVLSRGTVGGSLANADPAAELPCVAVALDAIVIASSPRGSREIPARDFFLGYYETLLGPNEILTEVRFPNTEEGTGWSFKEFAHRGGDMAVVAVCADVKLDATGRYQRARIGMAAVDAIPIRPSEAEHLLVGEAPSDELWDAAAEAVVARLDPPSDTRAPAAYRKHLARVLLKQAFADATDRARGRSVSQNGGL